MKTSPESEVLKRSMQVAEGKGQPAAVTAAKAKPSKVKGGRG
jgi:hypothetical protein